MTTDALVFLIGAALGLVVDRFWGLITELFEIYREEK